MKIQTLRDTVSLHHHHRPRAAARALEPEDRVELSQKLEHPHRPDQLLVKLRPGRELDLAAEYSAEVLERFDLEDAQVVLLDLGQGADLAHTMERMVLDSRIEYAEPNHLYALDDVAPDDLDPGLWGLHNTGQDGGTPGADISAPEAWATTTGTPRWGPLIAVIDTGADWRHPDLAANIWTNPNERANGEDDDGNGVIDDLRGYNALSNDGFAQDGHGHGTHVSGTIAAEGNNGQGVVGVNWRAEVMPVKIFSDGGRTDAASILRGVLYANTMGARITSNSWGGGAANQALKDAFGFSKALHVAAAGNDGIDTDARPHYPSSYDLPNMVAVAATDRNDNLARFSNYGAQSVDLAAPGVDILSTLPGGNYGSYSGTSMATPHVSGAAALIVSAFPEIDNQELKTRLTWSTDPLPNLAGKVQSAGRLNVARALEVDEEAPAAAHDLVADMAVTGMASVRWTSTGDDGAEGDPSAYDLRISNRPITEQAFADLPAAGFGRAKGRGAAENKLVEIAPSGRERTYHLGLRLMDNVGNLSPVSTATLTVPAVPVAFEDDMEAQETAWEATGDWARVEVPGHGMVWTEAPGGDYGDGNRGSLTSPEISLEGFSRSVLHLDVRHDLEKYRDNVFLEVSSDGESWRRLERFTGESDWSHQTYDLSAYDGAGVQLRLRTWTNDGSAKTDGLYLDNVVITGQPL